MAAKRAMPAFEDGMLISITALRRPLVIAVASRLLALLKVPLSALRRGAIEQLPTWWQATVPCQLPEAVHDIEGMLSMLCRCACDSDLCKCMSHVQH